MMKATSSPADLSEASDEELMGRYRDLGRAEDFNELVRRYERELYRYLARYLGDPALADDVFQNTFLQVHLKRNLYEEGRPLRPWLYSIATHQAVDALRKQGRHPTLSLDVQAGGSGGEGEVGSLVDLLVSEGPGPLATLQGEERKRWIQDSIQKLPPTLRETLIMAYYQDLKYREIADALNVPVGTIKSRLHAAIAKLQQMARADGPDNSE
jgi:RNA polymerase sigma-70 factor (ECF subfamily)